MKLPFIKKIKKIPKETLDNTKKIESEYKFQDLAKEGDKISETISEKPVEKKEETKPDEKLIESKPDTFEKNKETIINEVIDSKKQIIETKVQPETKDESVLTPDSQGIMRLTEKALGTSENTQQIIFRDASSVIAEKLPEQLGTDPLDLKKGKYDVRRLTNINELERVWIGYFDLLDPFEGGDWAKGYANEYMNLSMAIHGERAKLLVKMQMAASGGNSQFKKPEDKRNFIERHFTKRGQEPKDDDIDEL